MEIRNLMEDRVIQTIDDICNTEEQQSTRRYCTTPQCRTDVACFVLNRVPQRYVSSGRGFAYLESDFNNNTQLQVDIVALVHEGLRRVSEIQRSFYQNDVQDRNGDGFPQAAAAFFFPTIKGRLFDGLSFEPIKDVAIRIIQEGRLLEMVDGRWPNPYSIVGNTPGTYLFWPKPVPSDTAGQVRVFEFELIVDDPRFEPFSHYFTISLSSLGPRNLREQIPDFSVTDLFLLPRHGGENDMQLNPPDPDLPR